MWDSIETHFGQFQVKQRLSEGHLPGIMFTLERPIVSRARTSSIPQEGWRMLAGLVDVLYA